MRMVRDFVVVGIVVAIAFLPMLADAQRIVAYRPVTDRQLTEPESSNWLMTRGNYQGWSYSALDQVNVQNVKKLTPRGSGRSNGLEPLEAPAAVRKLSTSHGEYFHATR